MMDLSPAWDWQTFWIILGTLLFGLFVGAALNFGASQSRIKPR